MPSTDRPPQGGPLNTEDDEAKAAEAAPIFGAPRARDDVVSLTALLTARLLRLRPVHGPRPTGQRVRDSLEIPRWALSLGFLLLVLLFLAMLAFFFVSTEAHAASESINFDKPTKDWYQGPVRYIITHQEIKAYKALETEVDRQNFIDWVWQRRDLDPRTPINEAQQRFAQTVYEATRAYDPTAQPG